MTVIIKEDTCEQDPRVKRRVQDTMASHLSVKNRENVSDSKRSEVETTLLARVYYEQLKTHYPTLIVQFCYGCSAQDRRLEAHNM